jgi:hypothetical protein
MRRAVDNHNGSWVNRTDHGLAGWWVGRAYVDKAVDRADG